MVKDDGPRAVDSQPGEGGGKKNDWFFVNPYLVLGVVGASFCFAWFFAVMLSLDFPYAGGIEGWSLSVWRVPLVGAMLAAYLLIWLFSNALQKRRGVLLGVSIVCGIAGALPGGGYSFIASLVEAVCAGVGVAALATLWIEFLCSQLKGQVRSAVATMLALSFLWYAGALLADARFSPYVIMSFSLISCAVYLFLRLRFALMDDMPAIDAHESDSRLQITWKPSLLTVMGSVAQGFSLFCLQQSTHSSVVVFALEGLSLVVVGILLVDSLKSFVIKEAFVRRLFLPVLAACILTLLFIPEEFRAWPCLFAFVFSLLPYASAIFATCEHIVRCRLSAVRAFSWARLYAVVGLIAGLCLGWLALESDVFGDMTLPVWVVIVVMFFIVVSATLSVGSFYPGDEASTSATVHIGANGEILPDPEQKKESGRGHFLEKCDAFSAEYGLTNRESEVLVLLAKGRNAAYIQNKLFISQHTVKAHIYAIYKKTGEHSQQGLMDMVEDYVYSTGSPSGSDREAGARR